MDIGHGSYVCFNVRWAKTVQWAVYVLLLLFCRKKYYYKRQSCELRGDAVPHCRMHGL